MRGRSEAIQARKSRWGEFALAHIRAGVDGVECRRVGRSRSGIVAYRQTGVTAPATIRWRGPIPKARRGAILWPTTSELWVKALPKIHLQPRRGDVGSDGCPMSPLRGSNAYLYCRRSHGWLAVGYMTTPALRALVPLRLLG